jgi:hypothetical protein
LGKRLQESDRSEDSWHDGREVFRKREFSKVVLYPRKKARDEERGGLYTQGAV